MSGRGPASGVSSGAAGAEVNSNEIDRIVAGAHYDPHSVLGAHPGPGGVQVRELLPLARTAAVVRARPRRARGAGFRSPIPYAGPLAGWPE